MNKEKACIEYRAEYDNKVKVIELKDYDEEMLYDEETGIFFEEIALLQDYYKEKNWDMPQYVYGCIFEPFQLNLNHILESEAEDEEHHDEILEQLNCLDKLEEAICEFNKANKSVGTYFIDETIIIRL